MQRADQRVGDHELLVRERGDAPHMGAPRPASSEVDAGAQPARPVVQVALGGGGDGVPVQRRGDDDVGRSSVASSSSATSSLCGRTWSLSCRRSANSGVSARSIHRCPHVGRQLLGRLAGEDLRVAVAAAAEYEEEVGGWAWVPQGCGTGMILARAVYACASTWGKGIWGCGAARLRWGFAQFPAPLSVCRVAAGSSSAGLVVVARAVPRASRGAQFCAPPEAHPVGQRAAKPQAFRGAGELREKPPPAGSRGRVFQGARGTARKAPPARSRSQTSGARGTARATPAHPRSRATAWPDPTRRKRSHPRCDPAPSCSRSTWCRTTSGSRDRTASPAVPPHFCACAAVFV